MATFEVTGPDGKKYRVEGATAEGAAQAVAKMLAQMPAEQRQPGSLYQAGPDAPLTPATTETGRTSTGEIDRFGDTIADAVREPAAMTGQFVGALTGANPSPTLPHVPEYLPNALRAPIATLGDAAGAVLGGVGTAYAYGAGTIGEVFGGTPTGERRLARDLMMAGQVAVPELAGVSSAMRGASAAASAARRLDAPPTDTQRGARAATELGITPSLAAGGKVRGAAAAAMEKVPGTTGVIARDAERFVGDVESAVAATRAKLGSPVTSAEAGRTLQEGLGRWVLNFKGRSGELFDEVARKMPPDTKIQTGETAAMIRDAILPFAESPEIARQLGLNKWAAMVDELDGGMTWEAASALRTSIGRSIGEIRGPLADMDQGRLKQAYAALTRDLERAAVDAGPEAEAAWRRANNYYKRGAERIERALDKTITADEPERAFEAFVNMGKRNRSSAASDRMWRIKASMPKDEWGEIAATIVERMGEAAPGAQNAAGTTFSPAKFLTEWNRLSPEAKSVLFPQSVREELGKLADVAELAKRADAERNFSNTGHIVSASAATAGMMTAPLTTAGILAGANISARALTSPVMLRAMNAFARGDSGKLKAIAAGGGPLARDAQTLLRMEAANIAAQTAPEEAP